MKTFPALADKLFWMGLGAYLATVISRSDPRLLRFILDAVGF